VDCTAQGSSPVIVLNISEEILGKLPYSNGTARIKNKKSFKALRMVVRGDFQIGWQIYVTDIIIHGKDTHAVV
jgi:hypothetical protein